MRYWAKIRKKGGELILVKAVDEEIAEKGEDRRVREGISGREMMIGERDIVGERTVREDRIAEERITIGE